VFLKVKFVFLCFCVSVYYFGFMLLVLLGFVFFQYQAKRLAGKTIFKMTYFVLLSGMQNRARCHFFLFLVFDSVW